MKSRIFLLLVTVCLSGGARQEMPSRTGAGWTRLSGTLVGLVKWGNGTALLIFCPGDTDRDGSAYCSSSASGLTAHCWLRSKKGPTVDWWCQTSDGRTGDVRINGQQFKLDDGSLFLVSTQGARHKSNSISAIC